MTDISNWHEAIHIMKMRFKTWLSDDDNSFIERIMVPINEYQMGNLIGALSRAREDGDWYGELCDIIGYAMKFAEIKSIRSNDGQVFSLEEVQHRLPNRKPFDDEARTAISAAVAAERERMQKLIDAYEEYVKLLSDSEASLISLAHNHGVNISPKMVERGCQLRELITILRAET